MFDSFGLDISDGSIKYAYVKRGIFGVTLQSFGDQKIPEGIIINGEIKDRKAFSQLLHEMIKAQRGLPSFVVASLPDSKTFVKLLTVTTSDEKHLQPAVYTELAKHIPIPIDQLVIDWDVVDRESTQQRKKRKSIKSEAVHEEHEIRVLVAACESHIVRDYGETLREAGLSPIAFEVEAQSTARAILAKTDISRELNSATIVIDWGETQATIMFFAAGTLVFSASSEISGREVTRKISEKLSMTFDQAEQAKRICGLNPKKCKGVVRQYLEEYIGLLADEVKKGLEFYISRISPNGTIQSIILVGGGSNSKDLDVELEQKLAIGVRPVFGDVFRNIPDLRNPNAMPPVRRVSFATVLGLALRATV